MLLQVAESKKQYALDSLKIMIESHYLSCEETRDWATRLVSISINPQAWLIELACAKNSKEALEIVVRKQTQPLRVLKSGQVSFCSEMSMDFELREQLWIGFSYLRYRRGDSGMREFEDDVSYVTDADFDSEWGLDEFRHVLNDPKASAAKISGKIEALYGKFGEEAKEIQEYVMSDSCFWECNELFENRV